MEYEPLFMEDISLTADSDLGDTSILMTSSDYKKRFLAEYWQLMIRRKKLNALIGEVYHDMMENKPVKYDCPVELLHMQADKMKELIDILRIRAKMEGIEL